MDKQAIHNLCKKSLYLHITLKCNCFNRNFYIWKLLCLHKKLIQDKPNCLINVFVSALDLKSSIGVYQGEPKNGKADTTLTVSDDDMIEIAAGTLSPQVAYLKGKIKISGNIMLAQKLGPLLKSGAKL